MPRKNGRHELIGALVRGGIAVVWLAWRPDHGRRVASELDSPIQIHVEAVPR